MARLMATDYDITPSMMFVTIDSRASAFTRRHIADDAAYRRVISSRDLESFRH